MSRSKHQVYPTDYGEDNSTSDEEEPDPEKPPRPQYRPPVPGGFVLTLNVLALVTASEIHFPHGREYWHTVLRGTLDQACACFSVKQWVDTLVTCEDEEMLLTVYNNFLDTTWKANDGLTQYTGEFPLRPFTQEELLAAWSGASRRTKRDLKETHLDKTNNHNNQPLRKERKKPPEDMGYRVFKQLKETIRVMIRERMVLIIPNDQSPPKGDEAQEKKRKDEQKESRDEDTQDAQSHHSGDDQPKEKASKEKSSDPPREKTPLEKERDEALAEVKKLQDQIKQIDKKKREEEDSRGPRTKGQGG